MKEGHKNAEFSSNITIASSCVRKDASFTVKASFVRGKEASVTAKDTSVKGKAASVITKDTFVKGKDTSSIRIVTSAMQWMQRPLYRQWNTWLL
jgi:hypothetical protein